MIPVFFSTVDFTNNKFFYSMQYQVLIINNNNLAWGIDPACHCHFIARHDGSTPRPSSHSPNWSVLCLFALSVISTSEGAPISPARFVSLEAPRWGAAGRYRWMEMEIFRCCTGTGTDTSNDG